MCFLKSLNSVTGRRYRITHRIRPANRNLIMAAYHRSKRVVPCLTIYNSMQKSKAKYKPKILLVGKFPSRFLRRIVFFPVFLVHFEDRFQN